MEKRALKKMIRLVMTAVAMAAVLALAAPALAAKQDLGAVKEVRPAAGYVELSCVNGRARVSTKGPGLLHVVATDDAEFSPLPSFALDPDGPAETAPPMKEESGRVLFSAGSLSAVVDKKTGRMEFLDGDGRPIVSEPADGGVFFDGNTVGVVKTAPPDEHYYGFGEKTGPLDKRGTKMAMWNSDAMYGMNTDPMYQSHPVYLALRQGRAYGLFFDNSFHSEFDVAKTRADRVVIRAHGGEVNYWIMAGPSPKDALTQYGQLVGRMPLPPIWGVGYHQCRYSYKTADRVREIAANFIKRRIPCDAIYLDIHYMDGFRVFTFNPQRFPDPAGLIADLRKDGIRTVVIIDPGIKIDPAYPPYVQGLEKGYFVLEESGSPFSAYVWPKKVYYPDFYQPAARAWFGNLLRFYTDLGVAGFWCDMNEPAGWKKEIRPLPDFPVPLGLPEWERMRHGRTPQPILPHAQVHNVYASLELEGVYDGLKQIQPDSRPFTISRAGYPGIQRHSMIWTGDNSSTWGHLEMALPLLLNMGLSGLAFVGSDVGGFVGAPSPEMYARWIQQGVFYPFCRTHTAIYMPDQEPWSFGPKVEEISREAIKLRYRLLPYTYSLFQESSDKNWPIMRAMVFEFPEDQEVAGLQDQFMWGPSLLVAPVLEKGKDKRAVYLPKGKWFEWPGLKEYAGPARIEVSAPLNRTPIFIREGAIIPLAPDMQFTGQKPWDPLTVAVFPGSEPNRFSLYEDDMESFDYLNGTWAKTVFLTRPVEGGIEIRVEKRVGDYDPNRASLELRVFGLSPQALVMVTSLDGKIIYVSASYDPSGKVWRIMLPDNGSGLLVTLKN